LTIYGKQWTTLDLAPLAALPHLESLHLISKAPTLDLSPLAQHATLTRVSLQFPALQHLDLEPLAACTGLTSLNLEYIPVQDVTLFPWSNLHYLTLNNVPVTTLDLLPLTYSQLYRLRLVKHALKAVDLTPLINTESLESIFITPATRMLLDDVYARNNNHIVSPAIFELVKKRACIATGRYTRLTVLLRELTASPPPSREIDTLDMAAFWSLIEEARATAARRTDDFALELTRILWALFPTALQHFDDRFWEAMRSLGRDVHHSVYAVNGGCSDDAFMDFRQWLVAQGQTAFQSVVDNPQILHEWGEGGIGFEEGIVSTPLYRVQQARGIA
jgi:hypothetical protein